MLAKLAYIVERYKSETITLPEAVSHIETVGSDNKIKLGHARAMELIRSDPKGWPNLLRDWQFPENKLLEFTVQFGRFKVRFRKDEIHTWDITAHDSPTWVLMDFGPPGVLYVTKLKFVIDAIGTSLTNTEFSELANMVDLL